jgi:glyoxylase I family protein
VWATTFSEVKMSGSFKVKAHHMSFPVKDLKTSVAFYKGVLGLEEIPRPDRFGVAGMWLQAGACEVHLIEVGEGVDVGTTPKMVNPGARHAAFEVEDYQEAVDHIQAAGLFVFTTNPEIGQMWIADPDGHVIELIKPA